MSMIEGAAMICLAVIFAGLADWAWLTWGRPIMTRRYGWPPVRNGERIPMGAVIGASGVLALAFVLLHVGAAAGF